MMGLDGFESIYAFCQEFGGATIYVPHARSIFSRCLEAEARREFNGKNLPLIAKKYGYTERHIRRILE